MSDVIAPRSPRRRVPYTQDEEIVDSNDSSGGLVVLAVDDEEPALEELAYLLKEDPRVGVVLKASDATDALRILNSRQGVREAATAGQAVGGRALNPMTGMRVAERFPDADLVPVEARKPLLARLGIGAPAAAGADLVLVMAQAADIRATWARYGL